jgi:hypothetical protein
MFGRPRSRWLTLLVLAFALALAGVATSPAGSASALSRWTGGIDLYRPGTFTTQQTWLWCTAADVQIARNIVDHVTDHTRADQQRYFDFMRAHNRYLIPVKDGVDPGGWTAGLRRYVDSRYRLVASGSFDAALRSAVTSLRRTNLPVAITVSHGNHAWLLTGFSSTADPAATGRFTVTSVRVVGPLWGLQSRSYGYDMRPDTKLTPAQLRTFFTPWHYAGVRMTWEGDWVSVQPIGSSSLPAPAPTTKPSSTPMPTAPPTPTPAAPASPSIAMPLASTVQSSTAPTDLVVANPAVAVDAGGQTGGPPIASSTSPVGSSSPGSGLAAGVAGLAAGAFGVAIAARAFRRRGRP